MRCRSQLDNNDLRNSDLVTFRESVTYNKQRSSIGVTTSITAAGTHVGGESSTNVSKSSARVIQARRDSIKRIFENQRIGPNAKMLPKTKLHTDISHLEG